MASNALSQEEDNYVRMALLLTGISPHAVRVLFDKEFPPASISSSINNTNSTLKNLKSRKIINQIQWDFMFPTSGVTDSKNFDLTLMIALLRHLTALVPPINGYDYLPPAVETTPSSDLARIKYYRNFLAHLQDAKINNTIFTTAVTDITNAIFRLGGNSLKEIYDHLMTKSLDLSSKEIVRDIIQANAEIEDIKKSIDFIQTGHIAVEHGFNILKSDHENLTESHELLQLELTGSKTYMEMLNKDVTKLQIDQDSMGKSHQLLQLDHLVTKTGVMSLKSDWEMMKKHQDLLQEDSIKTRTDVNTLLSIEKDYVPKNRRELIGKLLMEWKKNANNFVETRAVKTVLKNVKKMSCITITGNCGVGKTATLRCVALKMKEEGYDILPVAYPNDILQFCNPKQKTLFVIDDFCGTYSINQSDINNWEPIMDQIDVLFQNKFTKIIVACRLQVYQDKKFESLSIFRTCVCNLLSKDLRLTLAEKKSIAQLYLDSKASEIIQYCDLYDFFPLLCKLYHDNPQLSIADYFKAPFSVYETEIDKLYKKGHTGKYCALALCVVFNNRLNEEFLTEDIDAVKRTTIENICEACRLDRGTSRLVLLDELKSLEHSFINKEQGVYKTKHDGIFDFLSYYFKQNMINCLIKNADSDLIRQRFLLERRYIINRFITVVPLKYHNMYMQRMIDDWCEKKVQTVFGNINLQIPELRQRFLRYLKMLDIPLQRKLALTCDFINKDTVLIQCSYIGDINFIQWCIDNGVDVDQCNCKSLSPLLGSLKEGHIEAVKLLLEYNADTNKCQFDGKSPLYIACRDNHIEIVKLLLDNKANPNSCTIHAHSPIYIACESNNIEAVKLLLENKTDINTFADNNVSPLFIACQANYKEIVKLLLDNKADIDKCVSLGGSPLHLACENNQIEVVKLLLENKADIDTCMDDGESPLFIACNRNQKELVELLLKHNADINKCMPLGGSLYIEIHYFFIKYCRQTFQTLDSMRKQTEYYKSINGGMSPLFIACHNNYIDIVKILLKNKAETNKCAVSGVSPLDTACYYNNIEIVQLLLDNKADINKCRDDGTSVLHSACKDNFYDFKNNKEDLVKLLLNNKADSKKCDAKGKSPLFVACKNNMENLVKILLNSKVDINKCDAKGVSPLYIACKNNKENIVKLLLNNNADSSKCDAEGVSPLCIASCTNVRVVKLLLDHNADINRCNYTGVSPLHFACLEDNTEIVNLLLENKADINKCDQYEMSPLFTACRNNHTEIVKVLLDNKADVNKCAYNGMSPLHCACFKNNIEVVNLLLEKKADINKCMINGSTPVSVACENKYIEAVKVLLDNKADINKCIIDGTSPLFLACENNHIEAVKLLLDNKANVFQSTFNGKSPLMVACQNFYIEIAKLLLDRY